jgi:hypothetical protein
MITERVKSRPNEIMTHAVSKAQNPNESTDNFSRVLNRFVNNTAGGTVVIPKINISRECFIILLYQLLAKKKHLGD